MSTATGSARPSGRGVWRLSEVAAEAFGPQPQFAGTRRGPLRLVMLAQLMIGDVRADPEGRAVCVLSGASRRPAIRGTAAAVVGTAVMVGLWLTATYTWPVLVLLLGAAWLFWPMARSSLAGRPARRALAHSRPLGRSVMVHTVASVVPGAGVELIRTVINEADRRGWNLTLVAANPTLAGYYRQFGFSPCGPAVCLPCGQHATPMARLSTTTQVGVGCRNAVADA